MIKEKLGNYPCHQCAPKEWRNVPDITGDYDMDATIMHRNNPAIPERLALYVRKPKGSYGALTGYSGYSNYHGDS